MFLCQDQSRCLPKKFECDGIVHCIDGSDEIEQCKYPKYFRYLHNNQMFIEDWLEFLVGQQPNKLKDIKNYEGRILIKEGRKIARKLMFGLKCKSNYTYSANNYCTVPQPNTSSTKVYCENQEDRCFNKFEELTCFRCFDGTIVLNSQVCDDVIDCTDLSDECACENSRVEPLCKVFYTEKSLKTINFNFKAICNLTFEFPNGVDEKYCSNQLLSTTKYYKAHKIKCAKGSTANGNLTLAVLSTSSFKNMRDIVEGDSNDYQVQQPNILFTDSDLNGNICNGDVECPFREDECSQSCFADSWNYAPTAALLSDFIKCFSFVFKNLEPFSIFYWTDVESRFYFNESKLHYVPRPYYGNKTRQQIYKDNVLIRSIRFVSTINNISFELHDDLFKICRDNLLNCPWYFRCEHDQYKLIEINKVCDFNFDCQDQSDEKYCSKKIHLNSTTGICYTAI